VWAAAACGGWGGAIALLDGGLATRIGPRIFIADAARRVSAIGGSLQTDEQIENSGNHGVKMMHDDNFRIISANKISALGDMTEITISQINKDGKVTGDEYRTAWEKTLSFTSKSFIISERISIENNEDNSVKFIEINLTPSDRFIYKLFDDSIELRKCTLYISKENAARKISCSANAHVDHEGGGDRYAILIVYMYVSSKNFDEIFSRFASESIHEIALSLRESPGFYINRKEREIKILTHEEKNRIQIPSEIPLDEVVLGKINRSDITIKTKSSTAISQPQLNIKTKLFGKFYGAKNFSIIFLSWLLIISVFIFIYNDRGNIANIFR
jgi:hypothetical protein